MKTRKMVATICAAVMAMGTLAIEASAYGNVIKNTSSSSSTQITYDYDHVDGYDMYAGLYSNGNHQGARSYSSFTANYAGDHSVSFSPSSGSKAYIYLYESGSAVRRTITVPKDAPGMPSTLYTTVDLSTTSYNVKVISQSSTEVDGFFTVYGVNGL